VVGIIGALGKGGGLGVGIAQLKGAPMRQVIIILLLVAIIAIKYW